MVDAAPIRLPVDARRAPGLLHAVHATTPVGERVTVEVPVRAKSTPATDGWTAADLDRLVVGGGFTIESRPGATELRLNRERTLSDTVGPVMTLLVIGINPSWVSADAGYGYASGSNRFWPALAASGLACDRRDPAHLLEAHGIGMTDAVKRPSPAAADIDPDEFRVGYERLEWLCAWLQPQAVAVIGLGPWRIARDRHATVGWSPVRLGGAPVYVMGSTSGRNASTTTAALARHLQRAALGLPMSDPRPTIPSMAKKDPHLDHLANISMFSSCGRKELQLLARTAEEITLPAGSTVVTEGAKADEFFLIVNGEALVSRKGRKLVDLGPGDYFGELALFDRAPRNATVVAKSDLDVIVLGRREFTGLLHEIPTLAFKVCQGMARRLRVADATSVG